MSQIEFKTSKKKGYVSPRHTTFSPICQGSFLPHVTDVIQKKQKNSIFPVSSLNVAPPLLSYVQNSIPTQRKNDRYVSLEPPTVPEIRTCDPLEFRTCDLSSFEPATSRLICCLLQVPMSQLTLFHTLALQWSTVKCWGGVPRPRAGHVLCAVPPTGEEATQVYLFGGGDGAQGFDDLHALDASTHEWRRLTSSISSASPSDSAQSPAKTEGAAMALCGGVLLLSGGYTANGASRRHFAWGCEAPARKGANGANGGGGSRGGGNQGSVAAQATKDPSGGGRGWGGSLSLSRARAARPSS